jgi:hypothetical protein
MMVPGPGFTARMSRMYWRMAGEGREGDAREMLPMRKAVVLSARTVAGRGRGDEDDDRGVSKQNSVTVDCC